MENPLLKLLYNKNIKNFGGYKMQEQVTIKELYTLEETLAKPLLEKAR